LASLGGGGSAYLVIFIFGGFGHKVEASVELVERVELVELVELVERIERVELFELFELVGCWYATVSSLLLLGFFMSRLLGFYWWGFFIGGVSLLVGFLYWWGVFMVCSSIVFFCFSAGCPFRGVLFFGWISLALL
jgi:hypothetical protein